MFMEKNQLPRAILILRILFKWFIESYNDLLAIELNSRNDESSTPIVDLLCSFIDIQLLFFIDVGHKLMRGYRRNIHLILVLAWSQLIKIPNNVNNMLRHKLG